MFKSKLFVALIIAVLVLGIIAAPVLAGNAQADKNQSSNGQKWGSGDERPGWGYGDKNHEHIGPPGKNKKSE